MKTLRLAHYYAPKSVKAIANHVGDSLELSKIAQSTKAENIIFAGVRFMAETAKILNPNTRVYLPSSKATCSLVTQIDNPSGESIFKYISDLKQMTDIPFKVVTYINSSIKLKTISDVIVTSANVEQIVTDIIESGTRVLFTPDRNMGAYLKHTNPEWGDMFDYWKDAVCEVHDKFNLDALKFAMNGWTDGRKFLLAHPESPLPVLQMADYVGSTSGMLKWIKNHNSNYSTIFVATEAGLLEDMKALRPGLDIRQAPTYIGCQCNNCPYMKENTLFNVNYALELGEEIILSEEEMNAARRPIEEMINWKIKE